MANYENLIHELEIFHYQFFSCVPPVVTVSAYIAAHRDKPELFYASESEIRTINIIVEKNINALGIEPWLRISSKRHLLSRKLLLISYLAECDAAHQDFRQESKGLFHSFIGIFFSLSLGAFLLVKGRIDISIYGLL